MQTKGSNFYLKFFNEFLALYIEILCPRKGKGKINQESNNFLIFEPNITKSGSRITISITKFIGIPNEQQNKQNNSGVL